LRIILDYRPALRERTGVGEYVHELARALAMVSDADQVVAFSSSWKDRLDAAELPGIERVDAHVPVRILNLAWHRFEWPPIERFAGPADIAHSAHPLLMPARRAAQVITIHDLDFLRHPERTRSEIRRDYAALVRDHARRADLIVVSSQSTAREIQSEFRVSPDHIVDCPAGAPPWVPRETNPRHGYFLFVGTLEPRKNVGALLAAYTRLIDRMPAAPPLRLAGRAVAGSEDWLARLKRPPLQDRVLHLGYVDPAHKRDLYAGAIALIVPSLNEGFGLTALEAMTAGVPVVASRRGSLPEVLGDAALFVDPDDERAIADAMWTVSTDIAAARRLSEAGRARAAAFSWVQSAGVLRRAYDAAVRRRAERK
jgi:glycosyltransferase involved in cell wall biosynthesis